MADYFSGKEVQLRPHVKLYRATPQLAKRQIAAGAIGCTCAKLSEAETLVSAGIKEILIANQITGGIKMERLAKLAKIANVIVAVDNPNNVRELAACAQSHSVDIGVLVEVNIGHNRCGVAPFEQALNLSRQVIGKSGLKYLGLMGYDGHCTLKVSEEEREALSIEANTLLVKVKKYIENAGIDVQMVSGSGTFTYRFASQVEGITEIQAGTYLLMDTAFRDHGVREFDLTLSVLATVTSQPDYPHADGLFIMDAGRKSISPMLGTPEVKRPEGVYVYSLSDEHGRLKTGSGGVTPEVGEKVEIWVRDANSTISQFDRFYVIRDEMVEDVWPIPLCGVNT
jgi:D-serine deaminase-like pyridoxal phosphate-dependent protein